MSSQATITVAGITPPGAGKKQGHVIDSVGNKWNVWGDKLQNYRMGVTYDIVYETNEFNDRQFNVIKTANPSNKAPQDGWPGPAPRQATPPTQQPTPQGQQTTAKDEMIFVAGIINNAMSNANVSPFEITLTELIAMVDKARSAWRNTLGKSQRNDDDINDSILS